MLNVMLFWYVVDCIYWAHHGDKLQPTVFRFCSDSWRQIASNATAADDIRFFLNARMLRDYLVTLSLLYFVAGTIGMIIQMMYCGLYGSTIIV